MALGGTELAHCTPATPVCTPRSAKEPSEKEVGILGSCVSGHCRKCWLAAAAQVWP